VALTDKELKCKECGADFTFSVSEQEFYLEKGFENEPSRCPACRAARKQRYQGSRRDRGDRRMYAATCSRCGTRTEVPFEPVSGKPVYCRDCYQAQAPNRRRAY
jgi:CxxC-x17-CxxC domain-containing protein